MPGWHAVRSYLGCALGLALFAASILATGAWAERNQLTAIRERGAARLDLQAALLEQELSRYHYLPAAVRLNPDVLRLLAQPEDGALAAKVDRFLEALNQEAGASDLYVLNRDGKVLAASNWNQKTSFVGVDLSYRPYFQDALRTGVGRIYGIGTTTGEPGYYFAQAVDGGGVGDLVGCRRIDFGSHGFYRIRFARLWAAQSHRASSMPRRSGDRRWVVESVQGCELA